MYLGEFDDKTIIPYQEPPGNYNAAVVGITALSIIPYQEPPGNYNELALISAADFIIPYQETSTYKKNFF